MAVTEKEIEREIRATLEAMGCLVIKMHLGPLIVGKGQRATNPNKGFPDLFGWLPNGRGFAIEVKKPGHNTSKLRAENQADWIDRLKCYHVLAFQTDDPKEAEAMIAKSMSECMNE